MTKKHDIPDDAKALMRKLCAVSVAQDEMNIRYGHRKWDDGKDRGDALEWLLEHDYLTIGTVERATFTPFVSGGSEGAVGKEFATGVLFTALGVEACRQWGLGEEATYRSVVDATH
jgi:hypothetical protein